MDEFNPITRKEIHNNYLILSHFVRTLVKTDSNTDEDFEIRYTIFERMMDKYNFYGRASMIGSFGLMTAYLFKGKSSKLKVFSALVIMAWQPHIYTLGSHLGVYVNLKWAVDELLSDPKTESANYTKKFLNKLRERDLCRDKGEPTKSDSALMEEFYNDLIGKQGETIFKTRSYVTNRYFIENKDKYTANNQDNNPVLFSSEEMSTEDQLRLPIFDSFFTRYIYHTFTRWCVRVGQYFRVIPE